MLYMSVLEGEEGEGVGKRGEGRDGLLPRRDCVDHCRKAKMQSATHAYKRFTKLDFQVSFDTMLESIANIDMYPKFVIIKDWYYNLRRSEDDFWLDIQVRESTAMKKCGSLPVQGLTCRDH